MHTRAQIEREPVDKSGGGFTTRTGARLLFSILLVSAMLFVICPPLGQAPRAEFGYADLRALDPVDAPAPSLDMLAMYMQINASEIRIRLDMLDLPVDPDYDLYLALDTRPGGVRTLPQGETAGIDWDLLLVIPAQGDLQVYGERMQRIGGAGLSVLRNPAYDHIEVRINTTLVRSQASGPLNTLKVEAFAARAGIPQAADQMGPVAASERPPRPAQVVLAFWNTLPAYSPGEALRRWNGAHTGPLGGRHGLENLLWAVEENGVPVFLLDLLHPASLSALAALEGPPRLSSPVARGLVGLPVVISGAPDPRGEGSDYQWALQRARKDSLHAARLFELPAGPFGFAPQSDPGDLPGEKVIFVPAVWAPPLALVYPYRQGNRLIISTPGYAAPGATLAVEDGSREETRAHGFATAIPGLGTDLSVALDGPSMDIRTALAYLAQETGADGTPPVLLLGGDLPGTNWGDPRVAEFNLRYLQSRPWIRVLSPSALLTLNGLELPPDQEPSWLADTGALPGSSAALPNDFAQAQRELLNELRSAPDNALAEAAWQAYQAFFAPAWPGSPDIDVLRSRYTGIASGLLAAARWAEAPQPQAHCREEDTGGRELSCVLASETLFALFDPARAGLTMLVARLPGGEIHQVIGPSAQFISGTSDPYTWDLARGWEADPSVIQGAFSSASSQGEPVQPLFGVTALEMPGAGLGVSQGQQASSLSFASARGDWVKTFTLQPAGLRVEYQGSGPFHVQVPLALDPWTRFLPAWPHSYLHSTTPQTWAWGVQSESGKFFWVSVTASEPLAASTFLDSSGYLAAPEDPNFDYPGGHFLPFPLALVEISATGSFVVELSLEESFSWPALPTPGR